MADFDDIIQEINTNISDNNTQAITAKKLRDTLVDLTDAIETQQSEFEDGIQTQQSDFETNITNRQEAFENDVDEQLSSINTQFATGQNIGDVGIDNEPTAGSENLVKSEGVFTNTNKQSVVQKVIGRDNKFTRTAFRGVLPGHIYNIHVKNTNPSIPSSVIVGASVFIVSQGTEGNYTTVYEVKENSLPLKSDYRIKIPYDITDNYEVIINTRSSVGYEQYFYLEDITDKYLVVIGQGSKYTRNYIRDVIPSHKYRIYVKNTFPEVSEIPQEVQSIQARLLIYKGTQGNYTQVARVGFNGNPLQSYYEVDIPDNIPEDYEIVINTMSNGGYMQYFNVEDITSLVEIWDSVENKTSAVYNSNEIKSKIIITDDSANISKIDNLDSIAYENLTYRDIFETNNLLGIVAGFENGNYSPLTVAAGTPEITTEDTDSGVYSLKINGTSSVQLKDSLETGYTGLYFYACRAKCTRYVSGKLGITLGNAVNGAVLTNVTQEYKTCVNSSNATVYGNRFYVGSMSSANLTGYIDTPVAVNSNIFTEIPTKEKFTELYNNYVSIKKYSEYTEELIALETKKSNRITVLSENIGEEVGYIALSDGLYHNASNYYQGELINISSIKGEYIKLIPRIVSGSNSAFTLLKDNVLQDGEAPNFADGWSVESLLSPTELLIPSDANYLWVYTYRNSSSYIYVAPYIEIPTKYALSVLWEKQHPLYTYTDALNEFISEMNAKASRLEMTSTRFTSPSGLDSNPSTANYSTAKDMLKLMIEAISYPRLMKVWGKPSWTMKVYGARARDIELESTVTNPAHDTNLAILLNNYNILGGKTGSITVSGVNYYNYCVIAEKNNKFIVATLYKASSSSGRYSQMKTLLDNAFGLLSDSSYATTSVNAKCACCELPNVPTSILQNHLPTIIYSEGENDTVFIASTTKIMTSILACETLKNTEQLYYVGTDDVGGSGDDLNPGDISSFEDMMMDTMLPSSNGCAHCIARIAGNVLLENKKYM